MKTYSPLVQNQVDCIVRLHDASRAIELQRCLFSLYGQKHRPLRVLLVVQRFTEAQLADTEAALSPLRAMRDAPEVCILNFTNAWPVDARSELLNMGIAHATGQYLAFLDYDDVLYPEAYSILVSRLQASGAAVAFASVRTMNAAVYSEGFVHPIERRHINFVGADLTDLLAANFCPIHSYLIDRNQVPAEVLAFDPTLGIEEDYDLLIRLCTAHTCDFSALGTVVGDYFFKTDGSNTTAVGAELDEARREQYEWVSARIEARRLLQQLQLSAE